MRLAVLAIPISRGPSPARLCGQRNEPPQVRDNAKITHRCRPARRRGEPVIKSEVVEAG